MNRARSATNYAKRACLFAGAAAAALGSAGALTATATAADTCSNAAVRFQQKVEALPDCRAYEMVNPADGNIGEANRVTNIADDGNTVAYQSVIPGDDALGAGIGSTMLARRTPSGWVTTDANLASTGPIYGNTATTGPKIFSPDFSRVIMVSSLPGVATDTNGDIDVYRVNVGTGAGTLMSQGLDVSPQAVFGASEDLDRVLFVKAGLLPTPGLFASDGQNIERISLLPDGTEPTSETARQVGGAYMRGLGVGEIRDTSPWVERGGIHGSSDNARRVYFYVDTSAGVYLYLRDGQTTVPVSDSERTGDVGTMYGATFISATHDGASAYFLSNTPLTDDATPSGGVYRFDLASQTVTQITPDAGPNGLGLSSAIASDDQSHLYFTATAALDGAAQDGDTNLYVWTESGGVRFIAKANGGDRFSRVTPDGRYAVVLSAASLNGAPNNGYVAVYRYTAATGALICASCHPDGSPSTGDANLDAQSFGFPAGAVAHGRALTTDGQVVFATADRISSADQTAASDVYLYNNGTVSLLTKGQGDADSFVGDNSDDGRNIFVITRSALVGSDRDAAEFDVYNVRVQGGQLEPASPTDPCHGDDCQGPPAAGAPTSEPASSRVTSPGNVPAAKVAKRLSMSTLSAAQRSSLARTGKVSISVRVAGSGTVTIRGRGALAGRTTTLGSGRQVVLKQTETTVKVTFKLTTAARRELSRRHRLSVRLETRLSGISKARTTTANLTRAPR